jgi:hypothetical protein
MAKPAVKGKEAARLMPEATLFLRSGITYALNASVINGGSPSLFELAPPLKLQRHADGE